MLSLAFAALAAFVAPAESSPFEAAGLYLFRVTAVQAPDHPKGLGNTTLRADEVLIGPAKLKGTVAVYKFFTPRAEVAEGGGPLYSGKYPDFAYPAPNGTSRYWWAAPDGAGGWKTADHRKVVKFLPTRVSELLLKADPKPGSEEAAQQKGLIEALRRLEDQKTPLRQVAVLRELQGPDNPAVASMADRTLKNLLAPAEKRK